MGLSGQMTSAECRSAQYRPCRVGVAGAGPAGSFFAIWLLTLARKTGQSFDVTLYDPRDFSRPGPTGCNMCAGVITDSLVRPMARLGIVLPEHLIQRRIRGYVLVTRWGAVDIPVPEGRAVYSTYRGPGPLGMYPAEPASFDQFLLDCAVRLGAAAVRQRVCDVELPRCPHGLFRLKRSDGLSDEVDLLVAAFGVNSGLRRVFERLPLGYRPPRVERACQAELPTGAQFIEQTLRSRVVIFALGWRNLRFAALTPKKEHITVTLIGGSPSRADLEAFLSLQQVRPFLPTGWRPPERYCHCFPALPVTAAANPVSDCVLVVGDANVSRYLKSGIESSFFTAFLAAKAVSAGLTSRAQLRAGFLRECQRRYARDNFYGKALFCALDVISRSRVLSRAHIKMLMAEKASRGGGPLNELVWSLFAGAASYRHILVSALSPLLQWRLATSALGESLPAASIP